MNYVNLVHVALVLDKAVTKLLFRQYTCTVAFHYYKYTIQPHFQGLSSSHPKGVRDPGNEVVHNDVKHLDANK